MADRYTYIPLIGIFIVVAWAAADFFSASAWLPPHEPPRGVTGYGLLSPALSSGGGEGEGSSSLGVRGFKAGTDLENSLPEEGRTGGQEYSGLSRWNWQRTTLVAGGLAMVLACAAVTHNQVKYWRNNLSLFEHALAATKHNPVAHCCLGEDYGRHGEYALAEYHFRIALKEGPSSPDPYLGLGVTLERQGKHDEAREQFLAAARVDPSNALAHNYLGSMYMQRAKTKEALEEYAKAVALDPELAAAHSNLGAALVAVGRLEEAAAQFHAALESDPGSVLAHFGLASTLCSQGKRDEAILEYQAALRLNPTNAAALNDLAWIRAAAPVARLRDGAEAVKLAEQACRLTQFREPLLIGTLAAAYAEAGQFEDAVKNAESARELALAAGKPALAARNEQLLTVYRARKAYHEPR